MTAPIWRPDPETAANSSIARFGRFVSGRTGTELTDDLKQVIRTAVATQASPRHVPDDIISVTAIPHTRTGKKLEVPVKRLIQGRPLSEVTARDAVDAYDALAQFTAYARHQEGLQQ